MSSEPVHAFVDALGAEAPRGDWTVHVTIVAAYSFLGEEREARAVLQVSGGKLASWSVDVVSVWGAFHVEDGALLEGSPELEVHVPSSPLEVPQLLVAIAATLGDGVRWELATAKYGGNRVLAKHLRDWTNGQMLGH